MKLLLDAKTAIADPEAFAALPEYSCSIPDGTTIGKRWKRARNTYNGNDGWLLGEYAECSPPGPDRVRIIWRDLEVVR